MKAPLPRDSTQYRIPAKPGKARRRGESSSRYDPAKPGNSRQKRVKPGNSRMSDAQAAYGINAGRCTRQMRFGGISGVQNCVNMIYILDRAAGISTTYII